MSIYRGPLAFGLMALALVGVGWLQSPSVAFSIL
ncbi:MAG: hypothetical protein ACJARE_003481, partial [Paracoccaceae bacterium]